MESLFFSDERERIRSSQNKVSARKRASFSDKSIHRALKPGWAERLGDDHLLDLSVLGEMSDTALTGDAEITMQANGLPNTFVPGRNLLFLTLAAALAYRRGIDVLVGGMCETDYSVMTRCNRCNLPCS